MLAIIVVVVTLAAGFGFVTLWPQLTDLAVLAGPTVAVALYLLLRFIRQRSSKQRPGTDALMAEGKWIVIDGSNVMFWKDNTPDLNTVIAAIAQLQAQGYTPGVVFDANVGYKIFDRYADDAELAAKLGLSQDQTLVVPKGSIADKTVLEAARSLGAKVLTNDRYRDWAEDFPEVATPGHLIRGGYRGDKLWLDLP